MKKSVALLEILNEALMPTSDQFFLHAISSELRKITGLPETTVKTIQDAIQNGKKLELKDLSEKMLKKILHVQKKTLQKTEKLMESVIGTITPHYTKTYLDTVGHQIKNTMNLPTDVANLCIKTIRREVKEGTTIPENIVARCLEEVDGARKDLSEVPEDLEKILFKVHEHGLYNAEIIHKSYSHGFKAGISWAVHADIDQLKQFGQITSIVSFTLPRDAEQYFYKLNEKMMLNIGTYHKAWLLGVKEAYMVVKNQI